jgi:hypothetical protein
MKMKKKLDSEWNPVKTASLRLNELRLCEGVTESEIVVYDFFLKKKI